MQDPHLKATGFFQKREHPSEGPYLEMQPPINFKGSQARELNPAPKLGEHTDEVLNELGL